MNLASVLGQAASGHADRPALLVEDEAISYGELESRAAAAAAGLRARGVARGDRVALLLPNGADYVACLFGVWRLGAVAVPINVLLAPPEVQARVALSGAKLLLTESPPAAGAPELVACRNGEPAAILFTSGTSGVPKGAVLTHGSLAAAAGSVADALSLGPEDVVLGAAPFSHVLGLSTGILATLSRGGVVAVERRFEAERTLARMVETRTTILLGVPTMCIALCEAARSASELPPVRIAHVGGAAVPVEVGRAFESTFSADLYEGYGLTEMSGIATTYIEGQPRKPGSVGRPLGSTEVLIADPDERGVGEVRFRGPSVAAGYWENPEATAEAISPDGWLATGDVGYLDDDGYLFLVDRKQELVIRGGYNVYPGEVEEALYSHPDVLEAAVVGVADETLGEEVAALIVVRPGARLTVEDVQRWAKERVAAYKYPRIVAFVDDLPKTPTGKILKRAIDCEALRRRDSRRPGAGGATHRRVSRMPVTTLRDAVESLVRDGDTVALEGFTHLIPHAAGHELIRLEKRDLTLVRMTPDVIYDQLIGMGCARKLVFSWGGNPGVGSLHRLREAVEHGWPQPLELEEHSHAGMAAAYAAGAANLPFGVLRGYIGGDLPQHTRVAFVQCPFTGERLAAVPALRPDVGIVHAQRADRQGNVQLWGILGVQKETVLASTRSIVTVEEIVDKLEPRPGAIVLPHWVVDAVCVAARGAHPSYAHDYYDRDNQFYREWDAISRDRDRFRAWIDEHVLGAVTA
jgi:glutaconate CoA-transferase subunit A